MSDLVERARRRAEHLATRWVAPTRFEDEFREELIRFAEEHVTAETERCANICSSLAVTMRARSKSIGFDAAITDDACQIVEAAIRATPGDSADNKDRG